MVGSGLPRPLPAVALAALAMGVGTLVLLLSSELEAGVGAQVAFEFAVGCAFVGSGLWVLARGPAARFGLLSVAIGCAVFVLCWAFSTAALPYTVGLLFGLAWIPLLGHMVLAFPSGLLQGAIERGIVAGGYVAGFVLHPLPFLFWPGDYPPVCDACPANLALLEPAPKLARALLGMYVVVAVADGAVGLVYFVRHRWWRAPPRQRWSLIPVVATGCAFVALATATAGAVALREVAATRALAFATFAAFAALPFALLAALLRTRVYRAEAVSALVGRLGGVLVPDGLRDALAHAIGDPSLEIAYWVPEQSGYVDADGRPMVRDDKAGRAWTAIERDGRRLAAIVHDASQGEEPGLVETTGAALGLVLERERLAAALRARVQELRASRARIVQAGDEARRAIERDLHDGAQQRLVSLLLNVQLARRGAHAGPAASILDGVERELAGALDELRALAGGILPPALSDHGLGAAVEDLAGRCAIDVRIVAMPDRRLPAGVEVAAYFTIAEALTNAMKHAHAETVKVRAAVIDGGLVVEVADDGVGGANAERGSGLRGLSDRIEALDGRLTIDSVAGAGTMVRAELPSAS